MYKSGVEKPQQVEIKSKKLEPVSPRTKLGTTFWILSLASKRLAKFKGFM
jgi:hypothetical protein